jgi:DMSO/TMAO reductase YedYZ heme-binding membrane subunit
VTLLAASTAKTLWYLTRGTGVVALLLLTAVLVLGIVGTIRWQRPGWPRFLVADLHKNLTLLGIAFVVVHVVTTVADRFAPIRLLDAVVPFASPYRPVWLGLGAVAFDLLLALLVTSLVRARLGYGSWRVIHFLAYAAWPVALVHAFGTGSDSRFGWFALLGFGCAAAVGLAVAARLFRSDGPANVRMLAGLATVGVAVIVFVWYRGGPAQAGWAARAGTPTSILRRNAPTGATRTTRTLPATTFSTPFAGALDARLAQSRDASGDVGIAIDGNIRGSHVLGILHLTLWGTANGEGVAMSTSRVTFSPVGEKPYSGTVVGLNGNQVVADLTDPSGTSLRLALALRIDSATSTVTGTVRGGTA